MYHPRFAVLLVMRAQEIAHVSFRDFVHQQQFLHWQFGKRPPQASSQDEKQQQQQEQQQQQQQK